LYLSYIHCKADYIYIYLHTNIYIYIHIQYTYIYIYSIYIFRLLAVKSVPRIIRTLFRYSQSSEDDKLTFTAQVGLGVIKGMLP